MIRALEIPEDHASRVAWLERELIGPDLPRLATELAAANSPPATNNPGGEAQALAADPRLIDDGLSWMNQQQITTLLTNPTVLVGIQGRVLSEDSAYWSRVAPPADQRFAAALDRTRNAVLAAAAPDAMLSLPPEGTPGVRSHSLGWSLATALATAASLILTVDLWRTEAPGVAQVDPPASPSKPVVEQPIEPVAALSKTESIPKDQAWGFGKFVREVREGEEQREPPLDRRAYLLQLAEAAEAWGAKRPQDRVAIVRRLSEFRLGCSAILMADHAPLPEADREWLRGRCRSWASALDRRLAQAETDQDFGAVLARVDATVVKIAEALRARGDTDPEPVS